MADSTSASAPATAAAVTAGRGRRRRRDVNTLPLLAPSVVVLLLWMIVPLAPGGSTDIVARLVAQQLTEALRQTILVDNRPGAGTTLRTSLVAKAQPDGYTLLFTSVSLATNAVLYPKLPFDTLKDFAPIGTVGQSFYVLIVQPSLGVGSV